MESATANDSTAWDPKGLDRLDYFASKLKEHGVYFGWSHTYGFRVVPGDRKRLLAYDEIEKKLKGNTYALSTSLPDVQDLMIEKVVNLLKHKNPYTGKTYAEEPALCFIELQNEDDIFFYTSERRLQLLPDLQEEVPGAVRRLVKGPLRFAGKTSGGLGQRPARRARLWQTPTSCRNSIRGSSERITCQARRTGRVSDCLTLPPFYTTFKIAIIADSSKQSAKPAIRVRSTVRPGRPEYAAALLQFELGL